MAFQVQGLPFHRVIYYIISFSAGTGSCTNPQVLSFSAKIFLVANVAQRDQGNLFLGFGQLNIIPETVMFK